MRFSEDFIEKVRDASNIVDIISNYTELKRSGHRWMGRCPFPNHQEKTPSFSVSEDKQVYHCFGCKKGGNVFTFLQDYNGMSFPESIEFLARRAALAIPEEDRSGRGAPVGNGMGPKEKRRQMLTINRLAGHYFHSSFLRLAASHPARQYATQRGLSPQICEAFRIGYAPEAWEHLANYLRDQRVPLAKAAEMGLLKAREGRDGYFDLFRDRLIFPILAPNGDVLGFGGRVLSAQQQPKYLNSPETPVFRKGRVLYGLHETAKYIRGRDQVVVVEGYMDLLALYKVGIQNVVATMGTALTDDHAKLLGRYTRNIIVLFDGDEAGQRAQERSLPILLRAGLHPRGWTLPEGLDPDDFIKKHGGDLLVEQLQAAPDLFSEYLRLQMLAYRATAQDQVQLVERVAPILAGLEDPRLKALYIEEICQAAMLKRDWLNRALLETRRRQQEAARESPTPKNNGSRGWAATSSGKPAMQENAQRSDIAGGQVGAEQTMAEKPMVSLANMDRLEIEIVRLVLSRPRFLEKFDDLGAHAWMRHAGARELLSLALDFYRQSPEKFDKLIALLASKVTEPGIITLPESLNHGDHPDERADKYLEDCLKRLKSRHLQGQMQHLTRELRSQPSQQKLEQFLDVLKQK